MTNQTKNRFFSVRIRHAAAAASTAVAVSVSLCAPAVWAAEPAALIQGESVAITTQDMQADSLRMPPEMRSIVLQKPETVLQVASNLYARRVFAERAVAEGLDKDPKVAAVLRVARDKVLADAMLEHMDKTAVPSDAALDTLGRNIYLGKRERFKMGEEVKVSHNLFMELTPESKAKAEQTLEELKKGADFGTLAKERSADPGSAAKGGDLGYFAKGRMVPEFDVAAFALQKAGDRSGVIASKFGYHILQLDDRRPERTRSFEEVREDLIKEVRTTAAQDARSTEAQKIQQGAKVNQEAIEAFAATYKTAK